MDRYPKSIKKCVQLVTISNDCFLFSRQTLQESLSSAFNLWELTKDPLKDVFIRDDGSIQSELGFKRKQKILYIQKARPIFINKKGCCHYWNFNFPQKLYLQFINLKNKKQLENIPFFCVFPINSEANKLSKTYQEAKKDIDPEFPVAFGHKIPESLLQKMKADQKIISKINIDFIWKKRNELKSVVNLYANKKLSYHKILWINKQLENVSDSLIDPHNFLWKQIKAGASAETIKDDRNMGEVVGMKNIKNLMLINSYRIYGHFAYCCLEFYLDILRDRKIFSCENCGQYNYANDHSDRTMCNENENKICWLDQQAARGKRLRNKRQGVNKSKTKKPL